MIKKLLISSLVVVVALASLYYIFREPFDRFNPLIEQEYVYVEVHAEPTDDNGRFKYKEEGVTESGEKKRIVFTTSTKLDEGTLIRVLAKGRYTLEYEFIE